MRSRLGICFLIVLSGSETQSLLEMQDEDDTALATTQVLLHHLKCKKEGEYFILFFSNQSSIPSLAQYTRQGLA